MKEYRIHLELELSVNPEKLYNDWLDSKAHSSFTGGEAHISNSLNSEFSCWDGYISGRIKELEPAKRILQSWRTSEFKELDEDSILEVLFNNLPTGNTLFILNHWNLSEDDIEKYKSGWVEHYLKPMKDYYG